MRSVNIEDYSSLAYEGLMRERISRILMICSNYDAFIMEEDGQIEGKINREYMELNLSDAPSFIWTPTSESARAIIEKDPDIDLVICMFNISDEGIFPLASSLKAEGRNIPFVLLMHYSREIRRLVTSEQAAAVDYVFSWHGNAELILAIVKLLEDKMNAEQDILGAGVQALLLVEDGIRYYSTYLPELYKLVLTQSNEFLREALNEDQQRNRKRSRPKVLLATSYEEAISTYDRYKGHFLGIITDIGMVVHKGDDPKTEKLDAGIDLVRYIRQDNPLISVLMQSSQGNLETVAHEIGVGFVKKYSRTLFTQLSDFIRDEFGFGDFVFRDRSGHEYGRANSLNELAAMLDNIPDNILMSKTSRNMFSKWFFARGLFTLGANTGREHHPTADGVREFIKDQIRLYQKALGRGVIAEFEDDQYKRYISFARVGDGSLGGKARGLAFLNKLVEKHSLTAAYDNMSISIPRSIVIATDWFDRFIEENGLQYIIDSELSDDEILSEFVASRLPEELIGHLRTYLETVTTPLAIRSSSKLEDSNYQPFAGVYSTYMIPLTENREQMLRMLDKAIKSVYASAYYIGSRTYIQSTGNLQSEEKMAVIVQNICGARHGGLYYPLLSGVARSVNFYPLGNEKPQDGIVNMVFGLGKSVVDGGRTLRFSPRFPRKILQLSQPELALRDTQNMLFALDLRPGAFKISRNEGINFAYLPVADVIPDFNHPELVFSTFDRSDGRMLPGVKANGPRIVSYEAILKYGQYPLAKCIQDILSICREELQCDVEIEFAAESTPEGTLSLKLLQIRPISQHSVTSPDEGRLLREKISNLLLKTEKALGAGSFTDIRHILWVSPDRFDGLHSVEAAREVAEFNQMMRKEKMPYLLIGPGRWGSSDPNLGIPVVWSDISEAKMIAEYSIRGFQIEPSQGTHFFQNITSLGIGYLSLDTVRDPDAIDFNLLSSLKAVRTGEYAQILELPADLTAFIDPNTSEGFAGW